MNKFVVDRRKDNYDELLVLATDARMSRTRTNRWSTGLIIGAMLGTAAYVAAMTQQVEALRETAETAKEGRADLDRTIEQLRDDRDFLQAQLNAIDRYQDLYARLEPSHKLSNAISGLTGPVGPRGEIETTNTIVKTNIVWMVDGSRRFPMIDGDILWVPEGEFWIELKKEEDGQRNLYKKDDINSPGGTLISDKPYFEDVKKGAHDCIEIKLHDISLRPLFRAKDYVDIEVTYFTSNDTQPCG